MVFSGATVGEGLDEDDEEEVVGVEEVEELTEAEEEPAGSLEELDKPPRTLLRACAQVNIEPPRNLIEFTYTEEAILTLT